MSYSYPWFTWWRRCSSEPTGWSGVLGGGVTWVHVLENGQPSRRHLITTSAVSSFQDLERVDHHVMREHPHGRRWWNTADRREDHSVMCWTSTGGRVGTRRYWRRVHMETSELPRMVSHSRNNHTGLTLKYNGQWASLRRVSGPKTACRESSPEALSDGGCQTRNEHMARAERPPRITCRPF